jgi:hypothetical protein
MPNTAPFYFAVFAGDISASEDREKEFRPLDEKLCQKDSVAWRYCVDLVNDLL